jgi:hypothetical protein
VPKNSILLTLNDFGFKQYDVIYKCKNEITLALYNENGIIEVLLRYENNNVNYISLRFSVCQPISIIDVFFPIITNLMIDYHMLIQEGYSLDMYDENSNLSELHKQIFENVKNLKEAWIKMFQGDDEEVIIHVNKTWGYFMRKHPSLFKRMSKL